MSYLSIFRRYLKETSGLAAVEFSFILPIMLLLLIGLVETYDVIDARRRVTSIASTVGDLTARAKVLDDEDIDNIFTAAQAILDPLSSDDIKIRLTSVSVNLDDTRVVGWSDGFQEVEYTAGDPYPLPADIGQPGGSIIVSEVELEHQSFLGLLFKTPFDFKDVFYAKPRLTLRVNRQ
jgi:Flp pilus assembly protein TadG